ncbi:MAG: IS30 family transposase [Prevotella sp.]|uniref:IS30 family transposase n=1 Tax=Prevotella sp. TaxID=59823 RepID=UPI002A80CCF0|nr:IS30 family transposase [Prevotella sp.]MDY4020158.1 IS30 family transposase [Prevotella sp.]
MDKRLVIWKMDTIVGKDGKGAIVTLVEKKSCYLLMKKFKEGKQAVHLAKTVVKKMLKGESILVKSITTDNGTEFAAHEIIVRELNTKVFFAHPYASWEKGTVENMNGLIRQYITKKADFRGFSDKMILYIQGKLNKKDCKGYGQTAGEHVR